MAGRNDQPFFYSEYSDVCQKNDTSAQAEFSVNT